MHIYYEERVLPLKDGLPKYATMPKSFGGNDKLTKE
jgi:hypothetical protein